MLNSVAIALLGRCCELELGSAQLNECCRNNVADVGPSYVLKEYNSFVAQFARVLSINVVVHKHSSFRFCSRSAVFERQLEIINR